MGAYVGGLCLHLKALLNMAQQWVFTALLYLSEWMLPASLDVVGLDICLSWLARACCVDKQVRPMHHLSMQLHSSWVVSEEPVSTSKLVGMQSSWRAVVGP